VIYGIKPHIPISFSYLCKNRTKSANLDMFLQSLWILDKSSILYIYYK